jgi:hypothetical protein
VVEYQRPQEIRFVRPCAVLRDPPNDGEVLRGGDHDKTLPIAGNYVKFCGLIDLVEQIALNTKTPSELDELAGLVGAPFPTNCGQTGNAEALLLGCRRSNAALAIDSFADAIEHPFQRTI